jgi:hypothetical protein
LWRVKKEIGGPLKNFVIYTISGSIIALIAQAIGANLIVTLLASLLIPPVFVLVIAIFRYRGIV